MATPFSSVPWLANPGAWWSRDTAQGQLGVQIARNQIAAEGQRAELQIAAQKLPLQKAAIEANIERDRMQNKISQLAIDHELQMTQSQEAVADIYRKAAEDPEHWASSNLPKWVAPAVQQYPWLAGTKQLDEIFRFSQTATEAKRRADYDEGRLAAQQATLDQRAMDSEQRFGLREREVVLKERLGDLRIQFDEDKRAGRISDKDTDYVALLEKERVTRARKDLPPSEKYLLIENHVAEYEAKRARKMGTAAPAASAPAAAARESSLGVGPVGPVAPVVIPRQISTADERNSIPAGSTYIWTDGKIYLKK